MRSTSIIALLLGISLTGAAQAQIFRAPCHVDTLCPGVERGGGKIVACLKTHKSELSEQCFAALGHFMMNRNGGGKKGAGAGAGDDQGGAGQGGAGQGGAGGAPGPGDSTAPPPQ
jgi:hypothetical protein